jgi:hydroxyacylglutathione hydrolase
MNLRKKPSSLTQPIHLSEPGQHSSSQNADTCTRVLPVLKEAASTYRLTKLINTHHHWDHAGGNEKILAEYDLRVVGGKDCAKVTETPKHNSTFNIGNDIEVTALHTPCHTQDSICWFMQDSKTKEKVVFTGDTLFIGGCGRFFEGTAAEMNTALNEVLAGLPDDTKVYPGHEYTKANVKFLVTVEGDNPDVRRLEKFADENKETQGKFTIGDEKKYNAFMRVGSGKIQKATGEQGPVEVMAKLREMKNSM